MQDNLPHVISLSEAIDLTSRFRNDRTANLPICETFDLLSVNALIAVQNSAYLRIYLGEKENGDICCILVAADADGNDLLPSSFPASVLTDDGAIILEDAIRCPQVCPPDSPLNTNE